MIVDIFKMDSASMQAEIEIISNLVEGEAFLRGIGDFASRTSAPLGFPVIRDASVAAEMMTSQEIWDLPEPWPFQYFPGVIEDEAGRLMFNNTIDQIETRIIEESFRGSFDNFEKYFSDRFMVVCKLNRITDICGEYATSIFHNVADGIIQLMIRSVYLGGMANSPVCMRFFEGFLSGGLPCGWIGPIEEDGGRPVDCVQLFHLGEC